MPTIIQHRTIRPSTRLAQSKSYKIDTKPVGAGDTLIVQIDHEPKAFGESYTFDGIDVKDKDSISFRVHDEGTYIDISWSGVQPKGVSTVESVRIIPAKLPAQLKEQKTVPLSKAGVLKIEGLAPVVNEHCRVLILGTMPGAESLRKQAYYGNERNLFWKLMAGVTGKEAPPDYEERKQFLLAHKIALWDMCQTCLREGSLDSAISEETPNEIPSFVQKYPEIRAIAFNGKASERLFAKYFGSIAGIDLYGMPSTSPANAGIGWEVKVGEWGKIKKYLYDENEGQPGG